MDIIQKFIENNQLSESLFAKIFTEKKDLELKYDINIDTAKTNGDKILITPIFNNLYQKEELFNQAIEELNWSNIFKKHSINFKNILDRIYVISHALLIHECLHVIFTNFTLKIPDTIPKVHKPIIHTINNIIEDAYIEKAGQKKFKTTAYYLNLLRTIIAFKENQEQNNSTNEKSELTSPALTRYLNYMITKILYPRTNQLPPDEDIIEAIKETTKLFQKGITQENGEKRLSYSIKIYEKLIELGFELDNYKEPNRIIISQEIKNSDSDSTGQDYNLDLNNEETSDSEKEAQDIQDSLNSFAESLKESIVEAKKEEINQKASKKEQNIIQYNENIHKDITIQENILSPKKSNIQKYKNIKNKNLSIIKKYKQKFSNLLKAKITTYDGKYKFGSRLNSKNFSDPKRKYWAKKSEELENAEVTIQILIDGSGSMYGSKLYNAINASIIIHEILEANNIRHSIAEFRGYEYRKVQHNVLLKFNHKPNDKYNLLELDSNNGNRDGLALLWGMKKLQLQPEENKILIIISDGIPADYDYSGNVAIQDIKNIEKQCEKNKIKLIAIALEDNNNEIYKNLKTYYKNILQCKNPERLPESLANLINSLLEK